MPAKYWLGAVGSFSQASATEILGRIRFPNSNGFEETCSADDAGYTTVEIEDPGGDLSIQVWQPFWVTEPGCVSDPRIYTGFIYSLTYSRDDSLRTTVARKVTAQLIDLNGVAKLRVIRGGSGKRPVETTQARLDWLLGGPLDGVAYDNGFISVPTVNRDEADFRGQYAVDVLSALAQDGGFDAYFIWDAAASASQQITLVVEPAEGGLRSSTLKLSNSLADTTASPTTIFPPSDDAELERAGDEVYSGVLLRWKGGENYYSRAATDTTYFGDYGRDWVEDEQRIGRQATADAVGASLLEKHSTPIDTISCKVILPHDQVNLIRAGMIIPVKWTNFPGYTTFTTMKVKKRSTKELGHDTTNRYELTLELQIGKPVQGGNGGPPGDTPFEPPDDTCSGPGSTNVFASATLSDGGGSWHFSNPTLANDGDMTTVASRAAAVAAYSQSLWMKVDCGSAKKIARIIARSGKNGSVIWFADRDVGMGNYQWPEDGKGRFIEYSDDGSNWTLVSFSFSYEDDPSDHGNPRLVYDITDPDSVGSHRYWGIGHSESRPGSLNFMQRTAIAEFEGYECDTVANTDTQAPRPGQPVLFENVGTGTDLQNSFTTNYPFADGSLRVYVDRIDQTAAIVAQDGAAGTFSIAFAPHTGELIEVSYQGR